MYLVGDDKKADTSNFSDFGNSKHNGFEFDNKKISYG